MRRLYLLIGLLSGMALALCQNRGWRVDFGPPTNLSRNVAFLMTSKPDPTFPIVKH